VRRRWRLNFRQALARLTWRLGFSTRSAHRLLPRLSLKVPKQRTWMRPCRVAKFRRYSKPGIMPTPWQGCSGCWSPIMLKSGFIPTHMAIKIMNALRSRNLVTPTNTLASCCCSGLTIFSTVRPRNCWPKASWRIRKLATSFIQTTRPSATTLLRRSRPMGRSMRLPPSARPDGA
jgi:hypothetical protein